MTEKEFKRGRYSPEEVQFLRDNLPEMAFLEVADRLGRTLHSVKAKAQVLGIKDKHGKKPWTPEEDRTIIDNYHKISVREISETIGRTKTSVCARARRLGVKKKVERVDHLANIREAILRINGIQLGAMKKR